MRKKLNKNDLEKIVSSGFTDLSEEQIKKLISKELDKEIDKVDTDYIDLCFELFEIRNKDNAKMKRKNALKIMLIAAVFVSIIVSTISVSAQILNFDIPKTIAKLVNGNAEIDVNLEHLKKKADGYALNETELAKQISSFGISNVTIPEKLTGEDCKIVNVCDYSSNLSSAKEIGAELEYNGNYVRVLVLKNEFDGKWVGSKTAMDVISGKMINVNGMDILIFERDNSCSIEYKDGFTEYIIYLEETDMDTAIEIAKSIK